MKHQISSQKPAKNVHEIETRQIYIEFTAYIIGTKEAIL